MLKIGDFSRLSQVFIEALRLYDQMGLLQPAQVDHFTGYRYYSARLARVETRLQQIEQEDTMPDYEAILKKLEPIMAASIRETIPNYPAVGQLYGELYAYLKQEGIKPGNYCAAIWHDGGYKESDVDAEAVVFVEMPLSRTNQIHDRIKIYELPSYEKAACVIHHGSYKTLQQSYTSLIGWIEQNHYRIIGPNREVYIESGPDQDNVSYITEIQFPVEKIDARD